MSDLGPPPRCHYCEKPAVVYCDFVLNPRVVFRAPAELATCDRALCVEHRRHVGHMCDRSRRTTNNHSDTIDYCPEHERGRTI